MSEMVGNIVSNVIDLGQQAETDAIKCNTYLSIFRHLSFCSHTHFRTSPFSIKKFTQVDLYIAISDLSLMLVPGWVTARVRVALLVDYSDTARSL